MAACLICSTFSRLNVAILLAFFLLCMNSDRLRPQKVFTKKSYDEFESKMRVVSPRGKSSKRSDDVN